MKFAFDFDYRELPQLEGKTVASVFFGIDAMPRTATAAPEQFVCIELDDGTQLMVTAMRSVGEAMELELLLPDGGMPQPSKRLTDRA